MSIFEEYVDRLGDVYSATIYVAKEARRRAESTDNLILHSEAISWVISGEQPAILSMKDKSPTEANSIRSQVNETLAYVEDLGVCESVKLSINSSISNKHLIYIYKDVPDSNQQARVRVLTNILWYTLNLDKYSN